MSDSEYAPSVDLSGPDIESTEDSGKCFNIALTAWVANNAIDGDWSGSLNDSNSSTGSDTAGSLRDFLVDDSDYADSVENLDLQILVSDDSSSLNDETLSEIERQHRRHTQESSPAERIVRCDRATRCTRALLEIIEGMDPEEVNIGVSVQIIGRTEQGAQYPPSSIRIQRCDCMVCGVEQLHIAVPHQCKHSFSTMSAEPKLGMGKTNNPTSKSAVDIRTADDRAL